MCHRAFELPPTDISISYKSVDKEGQETWRPLLSDWDLDTAILGAGHQDLYLQVQVMEVGSLGEISASDSVRSPVTEVSQALVKELAPVSKTLQQAAASAKAGVSQVNSEQYNKSSILIIDTSQVNQAGAGFHGLMNKKSTEASGFFKRHYQTTLPGLTSKLKAAMNLDIEERATEPVHPPVSDAQFRSFLNKVGQVTAPREFRLAVYRGGLEPGLRKIAWKHLLNVYPAGMTGGERVKYLKEKSTLYYELKSDWMNLVLQGRVSDDVKTVMNMVRKDVLRTDRGHPFFAGEGNPNVTTLFNILTTYALNHPSVSYCQGMSDLASPLLVTIGEESHAYICFSALMTRVKPNFLLDGVAMTTKFQHLSEGLMYYDPEFFTYLKMHSADDLLFCYRWLLLEMKREFAFDNALRVLEVTWSSLPPATADTMVELWETRFSPVLSPSNVELAKPCETAYGKVREMRKMTMDRTKSTDGLSEKRRGRVKSETAAMKKRHSSLKQFEKSKSLANVNLRRKPLNSQATQSIEEENNEAATGNDETETSESTPVKKVTNLKAFYGLPGQSELITEAGEAASKSSDTAPSEAAPLTQVTSPCAEVIADVVDVDGDDPFDWVGYSQANSALTVYCRLDCLKLTL